MADLMRTEIIQIIFHRGANEVQTYVKSIWTHFEEEEEEDTKR